MRRWVNATAWIAGDGVVIQDALAGDPGEWLPAGAPTATGPIAGAGAHGTWDVLLPVGATSQPLHVTVGPARSAGPSRWRELSWAPALLADVRAVPGLAGSAPPVSVRPPRLEAQLGTVPVSAAPCPGGWAAGDSGSWLLLTGSYVPPLGVLGLPSDQLAVDQLAEGCATALVAQVADRLRRLAETAPSTATGRSALASVTACGSCQV